MAMALCAGGGLIAWRLVWVPRRAMQLVGMDRSWMWSRRACQLAHGQLWVFCELPTEGGASPENHGLVSLNRYTGALNVAVHQWSVSDSVQWRAAQDSVLRAMRARGGKPISCEFLDRMRAEQSVYRERHPGRPMPLVADEAWHFGVADVQMQAEGLPAFPTQAASWHMRVIAFGDGLPMCRPVRHEVRLLTPAEWLAREREALAEELGF